TPKLVIPCSSPQHQYGEDPKCSYVSSTWSIVTFPNFNFSFLSYVFLGSYINGCVSYSTLSLFLERMVAFCFETSDIITKLSQLHEVLYLNSLISLTVQFSLA